MANLDMLKGREAGFGARAEMVRVHEFFFDHGVA